jgi:signal transduction histidine kinase
VTVTADSELMDGHASPVNELIVERARRLAEAAVHEERRRLASQMHDSVGAMLFTIGASVRKLLEEEGLPPHLRDRLATVAQQANVAGDNLRRSLRALYTPTEDLALEVAVTADCRAFEERTGIVTRLVQLTDIPALGAPTTRTLVEAFREALLNVEKHAGADSVVVTLGIRRGRVVLTVVDDGKGLPSADARPGDGVGLGIAANAERLARLGGGFSVEGNEEGGATARAWVAA